ncbi:MAG: polymer-forming cytoskeletal protein, partial [Pyrinomonadaceae bacterium]
MAFASSGTFSDSFVSPSLIWRFLFAAIFLLFVSLSIYAQTSLSQPDEKTLVVEEATEMEIFAIGKTVIIKKSAKGVLSLGGDVIVEGRVEGDVATVGGSITQKEDAYIGGDVIILGGNYKHDRELPLRNAEKETVMVAVFEEELRNMSQNPAQILSPNWSWSFLAQRLLSVLFWFLISLGLTTIAPGAVSRAVSRFRISALKIFGLGVIGLFAMTFGVLAAVGYLPGYINAIVGLMALLILILTYVFGRVVMQAVTGKWIQRLIFSDKKQSE